MYIQTHAQLREIYNSPKGVASKKLLHCLEKHSINFIEHSAFLTLSTHSKMGSADCSPRGGKPGFVKVINNNCIIIPDAKGNNILDTLVNIIDTGNVGCLFFIPGVDETLRINGTAKLSTDQNYLNHFKDEKHPPVSCIEITISEVFLHCAKALMRSNLWASESAIARENFPSMGQMIKDQLSLTEAPESQEAMKQRYKDKL